MFMNDTAAFVDLSLLARLQRQLLTEIGSMRDDMSVLTAIVMRQDGTLSAVLTELRAMHSQHSRLGNRVRDIESRADSVGAWLPTKWRPRG
jgi:hypothetical protein